MSKTAERRRLREATAGSADWRRWGTYVSDRAWGTVREDYSADGSAWEYFPHEHARSRAYRWNEDALAGFCDRDQHLCLGVALWNERDSILKERLFGLSNREGNHGEDVKEYFFYLDNTPTHSYARMVYKYPQVAFPYAELVAENARRGADQPEYELYDAIGDVFREHRYFDVFVEYAKLTAEDVFCRIRVVNRARESAPIHVLPLLWYRNTWSWRHGTARPVIRKDDEASARTHHPALGDRHWYVAATGGGRPDLLFTENETNFERVFGAPNPGAFVKDGINDAIVDGRRERANVEAGSKAAAHVRGMVPAGGELTVCVRLSPRPTPRPFARFSAVVAQRRREADAFYDGVHAAHLTADERLVQRQAFAGLLWSKQFYHFDVHEWLTGDPTQPPPPTERWTGRNHDWTHFNNADVVLMPDKWEYPWYASWDLAFHVVVIAEIDPEFAKQQILLLTLPRSQHPHGTIPAFEWDFNAVNPPVLAWAAWQVYQLDRRASRGGTRSPSDGAGDRAFLASAFDALVLMLAWWVNRKDSTGKGVFGGGFLGLDNIGVFDRDRPLPVGGSLEQSDGTGWMAMFELNMMAIALELARGNSRYEPFVHRFGQHFAIVANVLQHPADGGLGLWDENAGFYFDAIRHDTGRVPLEVYSMVGLVPLFATAVLDESTLARLPQLQRSIAEVFERRPYLKAMFPTWVEPGRDGARLLSVVSGGRLEQILQRVLDETQFLSEYGVRSLSRAHRDRPYELAVGSERHEVRYLPGVSDNRVYGGNSNWRGPIWFPMNFLLIQSIAACARYYDESHTIECPTGSGHRRTLADIAGDLARRLTRLFVRDDGRGGTRAVLGDNEQFQHDPNWRDYIPFHEFFHGDTGEGLGASHQTGWTALVALLLQYGGRLCFEVQP